MSIPFGFSLPGGDPNDPNANPLAGLGEMLQSLGRMLSQSQGATAVTAAGLIAAAQGQSGASIELTAADRSDDGVAGLSAMCAPWVDAATSLAQTDAALAAWTPSVWINATAADWARFANPVVGNLSEATMNIARNADLPAEQREQLSSMLQPMQQMMSSLTVAMMQQQLGAAIGKLSKEILYAGELPMVAPTDAAAVLPAAVQEWAQGLGIPLDQVMPWIVTREITTHRLISAAPWVATTIRNAVLAHSSGLVIDQAKINEAMSSVDPSNPAAMEELLASGVLEPAVSPQQRMALNQLERLIALVEGWVDVVCDSACAPWVPTAQLNESYRRRRATASPAGQALGTLVGLELSPTLVREATSLWKAVTETHGVEIRDGLWAHPDFLPTAEDLSAPEAFINSIGADGLHIDE